MKNQEHYYREEYEKQVKACIKSIVELYYPEEYERLYGDEPTIGNNTFEFVNDLEQFITEKHNKLHSNNGAYALHGIKTEEVLKKILEAANQTHFLNE